MLSFKELLAVDYTATDKDQISKNAKRRKSAGVTEKYDIYHNTYSSAVQHAIDQVKKKGFEVDMDDYEKKVAFGPRKPSTGKTNSLSIDLLKDGKPSKKKLHMQVYGMEGGKYELNVYTEDLDGEEESIISEQEGDDLSDPELTEEELNLLDIDESVLTPAQRIRKKQLLKRNKARIAMGRLIASRRLATKDRIAKRAKRRARRLVLKRILKSRDKSDLSYTARAGYEKMLSKRKAGIDRISKRMVVKVRKDDIKKFQNK